MKKVTIVFLVRDDKILLAMKKRGFGEGKWNGVGGKQLEGEQIEETAKREAREEVGVEINNLMLVGNLKFYFPEKEEWNQEAHVYLADQWQGEPVETEEMRPKWFDKDKLPLDEMWEADKVWLPEVVTGKQVEGEIDFDSQGKMIRQNLKIV